MPRLEGCALPSWRWVRSPQGLAEAGPLLLTPGVSLTTCPDESSKYLRVLPGMGGRQQGSRGSGAGGVGVPGPSRFSSWQSQSRSPSRLSGLRGARGRGAGLVRGVWQVVRRAVSQVVRQVVRRVVWQVVRQVVSLFREPQFDRVHGRLTLRRNAGYGSRGVQDQCAVWIALVRVSPVEPVRVRRCVVALVCPQSPRSWSPRHVVDLRRRPERVGVPQGRGGARRERAYRGDASATVRVAVPFIRGAVLRRGGAQWGESV